MVVYIYENLSSWDLETDDLEMIWKSMKFQ